MKHLRSINQKAHRIEAQTAQDVVARSMVDLVEETKKGDSDPVTTLFNAT